MLGCSEFIFVEWAGQFLIARGANMEARNENEETALYAAASHGNQDVVAALVLSGEVECGWYTMECSKGNFFAVIVPENGKFPQSDCSFSELIIFYTAITAAQKCQGYSWCFFLGYTVAYYFKESA